MPIDAWKSSSSGCAPIEPNKSGSSFNVSSTAASFGFSTKRTTRRFASLSMMPKSDA
jgi:hypothetical protein